jgi:hypothetical protein
LQHRLPVRIGKFPVNDIDIDEIANQIRRDDLRPSVHILSSSWGTG